MVKLLRTLVLCVLIATAAGVVLRAFSPDIRQRAAGLLRQVASRTSPTTGTRERDFGSRLRAVLAGLEVDSSQIRETFFLEDTTRELHVPIPRGRPLEWILLQIGEAARRTPYRIADCVLEPARSTCRIRFTSSNRNDPDYLLHLRPSSRYFSTSARMAFLIDTFGFEADRTTVEYLSFPQPLTLALCATTPRSEWTAKIADEYHKEIGIRLPFEPRIRPRTPLPEGTIMVHHNEDQIRRAIRQGTTNVPRYSGFIASMGSRALEDSRIVNLTVSEIRARGGYLIDMGEAPNSRVAHAARAASVPWRRIDERIPARASRRAIDSLLSIYTLRAHRTGSYLVASGVNPDLIAALTARLPFFEEYGISLVYASQLVHHRR